MDWQPIETAPRDGTYFLATDGERFAAALFTTNPGGPLFLHTVGCSGFTEEVEVSDHEGPLYFEATHWMPLPPPPSK